MSAGPFGGVEADRTFAETIIRGPPAEEDDMKVGDLMWKRPVILSKGATISEAAKLMVGEHVSLVVLVETALPNGLYGVVAERDIMRAVAAGISLDSGVAGIASTGVVTVSKDEDVEKAAVLMVEKDIRHVPVLDEHGFVSGVVSMRDILGQSWALEAVAKGRGAHL